MPPANQILLIFGKLIDQPDQFAGAFSPDRSSTWCRIRRGNAQTSTGAHGSFGSRITFLTIPIPVGCSCFVPSDGSNPSLPFGNGRSFKLRKLFNSAHQSRLHQIGFFLLRGRPVKQLFAYDRLQKRP